MENMDAAAKLLMALPEVFTDLVDFALRKTGFKVVRGSLKERNAEAIAQQQGLKRWYKKICNDVITELEITNGIVTAKMLVALENQSHMSSIMPGRNLMTTAVRWDNWRREMKQFHRMRKELKTPQEVLDGVLLTDRMAPTLVLVVHFGQEIWKGPPKFTDTLECPLELKPILAECPANVVSFYNLSPEEIDAMQPGALRAVAISIHYAQQPEKLFHKWQTDPSFKPPRLDEMLDVIAIATGLDNNMMKQLKEEDMKKTVSVIEQYLISKGETREQARIMQIYIQNRRNRHITELQILKDLQSDFNLDEMKARQYMESALSKA